MVNLKFEQFSLKEGLIEVFQRIEILPNGIFNIKHVVFLLRIEISVEMRDKELLFFPLSSFFISFAFKTSLLINLFRKHCASHCSPKVRQQSRVEAQWRKIKVTSRHLTLGGHLHPRQCILNIKVESLKRFWTCRIYRAQWSLWLRA